MVRVILSQVKIGKMRIGLIIILNLFCFYFAFAQKGKVTLRIEPVSVETGETFTISVESTVSVNDLEIENLPVSFVPGYSVYNHMKSVMDINTGKMVRFYFHSETGAINNPGKYTIGPVWVKSGGKAYKSNTVELNVGVKTNMQNTEVSADQLKKPVFGVILTNKKSIYEGEPVLVKGKVYCRFSPSYPFDYQTYEMNNTLGRFPLGGQAMSDLKKEKFKGYQFITFEYDKQVFFPSGTGIVKIEPYSMSLYDGYDKYHFTSVGHQIEVKPLPENPPTDFIGAVGSFEISREINNLNLKQGDVFKLKLRVKGKGNLHNILTPKLNLPKGFTIYGDPQVEENFTMGMHGSEGEMIFTYNIRVSDHGRISLPGTSVSYFDPVDEEYISKNTDSTIFEVEKNNGFKKPEVKSEQSGMEELTLEPRTEINNESDGLFFGSVVHWIGIGIPLTLSIFFLFLFPSPEEKKKKVELREKQRKKSKDLSDLIGEMEKLTLSTDGQDDFYRYIERVIKNAVLLKLSEEEEMQITRARIQNFFNDSNRVDLWNLTDELLKISENARFGIISQEQSKAELLEKVKKILKELNVL